MTTEPSGPSGDAVGTRARAGRPAEIARLVTMGTSGVVTFGLVGFFGLSERQSSPDPGLATTVATFQPATSGLPSTTALGANAVSLATVVTGATVPATTPVPTVTVGPVAPVAPAAPTVIAAPLPVDAVSEQSR